MRRTRLRVHWALSVCQSVTRARGVSTTVVSTRGRAVVVVGSRRWGEVTRAAASRRDLFWMTYVTRWPIGRDSFVNVGKFFSGKYSCISICVSIQTGKFRPIFRQNYVARFHDQSSSRQLELPTPATSCRLRSPHALRAGNLRLTGWPAWPPAFL